MPPSAGILSRPTQLLTGSRATVKLNVVRNAMRGMIPGTVWE